MEKTICPTFQLHLVCCCITLQKPLGKIGTIKIAFMLRYTALNINRIQNYGIIKHVLEKLDIMMIYSYVARECKTIETRVKYSTKFTIIHV